MVVLAHNILRSQPLVLLSSNIDEIDLTVTLNGVAFSMMLDFYMFVGMIQLQSS